MSSGVLPRRRARARSVDEAATILSSRRGVGEIAGGALAVLVDDDALGGKGRGIFFAAAAALRAQQAAVMATRGRGLLSVAIDEATALRLGISYMTGADSVFGMAPTFLVSIEAASCPGTGISAEDRALTIRAAANPAAVRTDLRSPGHIMPLLIRRSLGPSATLAETAFALIHSLTASGTTGWCDILNDEGDVASAASCTALAEDLGLPWFSVKPVRRRLLDAGS
jgi:3,4-dihydroxy 2-butanone 4-phosphate synthase/GTP cyclohydrolase II